MCWQQALTILLLSSTVLGRHRNEITRFDLSLNVGSEELGKLENNRQKTSSFTDNESRYIAYRNPYEAGCYLEKMRDDRRNVHDLRKNPRENQPSDRVFYSSTFTLTKAEALQLAGGRIVAFCKDFPISLLQEIVPVPGGNLNPFYYEILENESEAMRQGIARFSQSSLLEPVKREIVFTKRQRVTRAVDARMKRQSSPPYRPGRFRGQTQSQYLTLGSEGQKEGKAEAEATDYTSRAIVSGSNGMGQAQSMSSGGSECEGCPGYSEFEGSERGPGRLIQRPESVRPGISSSKYPGGGKSYPGTVQPDRPQSGDGTRPTGIRYTDERQPVVTTYPGGVTPGGYPGVGQPGFPGTAPPGSLTYPGSVRYVDGRYPGGVIPSGGTSYPGTAQQNGGATYSGPQPNVGITYPGGVQPSGVPTYPGRVQSGGGSIYPGGVQSGTGTSYPGRNQGGAGTNYPDTGQSVGGSIYPGGTRPNGGTTYSQGAFPTGTPSYPGGVQTDGGTIGTRVGSGPIYSSGGTTYPGETESSRGAATYPGGIQTGGGTTYPGGIQTSGGTGYPGGISSSRGTSYPGRVQAGGGTTYHQGVQAGDRMTYPGGVQAGSGTTYPGGIQAGGGTTHPGGVQAGSVTTYPGGVIQSGGSTNVGGVQAGGGQSFPGGTSPSGDSRHVVGMQAGGGASFPGVISSSGGTIDPGRTQPSGTYSGETSQGGGTTYPGGVPQTGGTIYPGGVKTGDGMAYHRGEIPNGGTTYPGGLRTGGETTYPGGTTYPARVPPGESTSYPGGVQVGIGTIYPGRTQVGGGTAYPGGTQTVRGTTYPGEVPPRGGTEYPRGVTQSSGTAYPGGVTLDGGTTYPGGITHPSTGPYSGSGHSGSVSYPGGVQPPGSPYPTGMQPPGGVYPAGIQPPGGVHPAGIQPPGGVYPAGIQAPGGVYSAGIQLPGGVYPAGIQPPGGVYPAGIQPPGGVYPAEFQPSGGLYAGGSHGSVIYPGGSQTSGERAPGRGSGIYPGSVIRRGGPVDTYPGGVIPGSSGTYPAGQYPSGQYPGEVGGGFGETQYYVKPDDGAAPVDDNGDSHASSSVKESDAGTQASASADGTFGKGTAQSQVSGTYSGSGSFSAQAGTSDGSRGAQTHVTGGKEGATSSAQGNGGQGKSQTQVQLNSDTGATSTGAQSSGWNHGTNSQVQASAKGGMADAQANGEGSTSSQAQIGFQPYDGTNEKVESPASPFRGGGTATAQSGTFQGQSQSQLQGSFQYGITYTGAAQAGSGSGAAASRKPFNFSNTDTELFKRFNRYDQPQINHGEKTSDSEREATRGLQGSSSSRKTVVAKHTPTRIITTTLEPHQEDTYEPAGLNGEDDEYDDDDYEDPPLQPVRANVPNNAGRQTQSINLGNPDGKYDIDVTQDSTKPSSDLFGSGSSIEGYKIPPGFRARVNAVSGEKTAAHGTGNSQAQTVALSPTNREDLKPLASMTRSLKTGRQRISSPKTVESRDPEKDYHNDRQTKPVQSGFERSMPVAPIKQNYYTVTNSVTGKMDDPRRKYEHRYYTKSSTCGYFTFSCNVVYGSNGRTKICKPKVPTYPDGTPMKC